MSLPKKPLLLEQLRCINYCSLPSPENPKAPNKETILQWLRGMTLQQQQCAISVTSENFVRFFFKMVNQDQAQPSSYLIYNGGLTCPDITKDWATNVYQRHLNLSGVTKQSPKDGFSKMILDSVIVFDCYAANDTLGFMIRDFKQLMEAFEVVTDGKFLSNSRDVDAPKWTVEWVALAVEICLRQRYEQQLLDGRFMRQQPACTIPRVDHIVKYFDDKCFQHSILHEQVEKIVVETGRHPFYMELFTDLPKPNSLNMDELVNALMMCLTDSNELEGYTHTTALNFRELKVFLVHKVIEVFFLRSQQAKVVNEVAEIFPLKGKSNILPTESKFRLFSKEEDESKRQEQCMDMGDLLSEREGCKMNIVVQGKQGSEECCECMIITTDTVSRCINSVLKQIEESEKEQQLISQRKKREAKKRNKQKQQTDNSDNVTSIDDSSLNKFINMQDLPDDNNSQDQQETIELTFPDSKSNMTKSQRKKQKLKNRRKGHNEQKQTKLTEQVQQEQKVETSTTTPPEVPPVPEEIILPVTTCEEEPTPIPTQPEFDDGFQVVESKKKSKKKKSSKGHRQEFQSVSPVQEFRPKTQHQQQHPEPQKTESATKLKKTVSDAPSYLTDDQQHRSEPVLDRLSSTPVERQMGFRLSKKIPRTKVGRQVVKEPIEFRPEDQVYLDTFIQNRMSREMTTYVQSLYSQISKYHRARDVVIQRLIITIRKEFGNQTQVQVFGSCATGLALPDSDIDLAILGPQFYSRQHLFQAMQNLLRILSYYKWVVHYKHIPHAAIPVLKLEINPFIGFEESTYPDLALSINSKNQANLHIDSKHIIESRTFQVDVTFDTQYDQYYNHIGTVSTHYIHQWIGNAIHPGFADVSLILKQLLKKKGLNDYFKGGVSSFCLAVMQQAIYQKKYQDPTTTAFDMLETFLKKYGTDFDPQKEGILLSEPTGFVILDPIVVHPLTVYSPITGQVISAGTISTNEILAEFRDLYNAILEQKRVLRELITKTVQPEVVRECVLRNDKKDWKNLPRELVEDKSFLYNYLQ